jgi:dephospho-CoA kinase
MQKAKVMEMADYTIFNNGSREELHQHVDEFLAHYGI